MTLENISTKRDIILGDQVTNSSVKDIINFIININYDDDIKSKEFLNFKREPINLYINTYGGSVYDGLGLINIITSSKTPVYTYALGEVMSIGLPILVCGKKRFAYKYSTMMYHQASDFVAGNLEDIKQNLKEDERMQSIIDEIILQNTKILNEKLDDIKREKTNWYISTDNALKLGIIDEII